MAVVHNRVPFHCASPCSSPDRDVTILAYGTELFEAIAANLGITASHY